MQKTINHHTLSFLHDYLDTKAKRNALLLAFVFSLLSPFDYSVFVLDIPEVKNLRVSEGVLAFGQSKRSGTPLLLEIDGSSQKLLCRGDPNSDVSCVPKNEQHLFSGEFVKVWWYEANIYGGFLSEKRLLQLEINNHLYLTYEKQKEKYLKQKSRYFYIFFIITFFSIAVFLLLQLSEKPKAINKKG